MQDKKGFIWLATWDGLCKFDGYNFTGYKTTVNDSVIMGGNNRIHRIVEDAYGYIWLNAYSHEVFKFDPKTEKYIATYNAGKIPFKASKIIPMPSGKVWLISETMGTICVPDSISPPIQFSLEEKNLPDNKVNAVFEDSNNFSWILTDNGLLKIPPSVNPEGEYEVFSLVGKI